MTMLWLDHQIFGNGCGLKSPYWDDVFFWVSGDLYRFNGGHGSQLTSFQWSHPRAGERRTLCGRVFRPFQSCRTWGRVKVSWTICPQPSFADMNQVLSDLKADLVSGMPRNLRANMCIEAELKQEKQR